MKLNLSIDLAVVITIFTVFLFANGNAYLGGYLHTFNITPLTLNYSIQDKIYIGYLKGFSYLIYLLIALSIYVVIKYIFISLNINSKLSKFLDKKFSKASPQHYLTLHNSTFYEKLDNDYKKHTTLSITILILLITTIFLLAHTEKKATSDAIKDLENLNFKPINLKSTDVKSNLFLITCGSNLCTVVNKENKNVTLHDPKDIIFILDN